LRVLITYLREIEPKAPREKRIFNFKSEPYFIILDFFQMYRSRSIDATIDTFPDAFYRTNWESEYSRAYGELAEKALRSGSWENIDLYSHVQPTLDIHAIKPTHFTSVNPIKDSKSLQREAPIPPPLPSKRDFIISKEKESNLDDETESLLDELEGIRIKMHKLTRELEKLDEEESKIITKLKDKKKKEGALSSSKRNL
jgi:hypothetical protein